MSFPNKQCNGNYVGQPPPPHWILENGNITATRRFRQNDRACHQRWATKGAWDRADLLDGPENLPGGKQCNICKRASHPRRRHPWVVPRPNRNVPHLWTCPVHKLSLPRRLRRPWLLLSRVYLVVDSDEGAVSKPNPYDPWQPWIAPGHAGLRLLRRGPTQIRQPSRLEALYQHVRLPSTRRHCGEPDLLRSRRPLAFNRQRRANKEDRSHPGDPTWWINGRHAVVRPRHQARLGPLATWRRLHLRLGHHRAVPEGERDETHL